MCEDIVRDVHAVDEMWKEISSKADLLEAQHAGQIASVRRTLHGLLEDFSRIDGWESAPESEEPHAPHKRKK